MNADTKAYELTPDSQYVELAVEVFAMLADATRVRLILALRDGELPVNALAEIAGKSAAAVSQHLAKMRLARLVATRQEGTKVFYRLQNGHAWQLVADAIHQAEHSIGAAPAHGMAPHTPREAGE
jgi:DNA-binding transcriptional ArsR family regulator